MTFAPSADAAEGERELDRSRPDIVLCDLVLPGSSGLELLKRVKRRTTRSRSS